MTSFSLCVETDKKEYMYFLLCVIYLKTVHNHTEKCESSSEKVRLTTCSYGVNQSTF